MTKKKKERKFPSFIVEKGPTHSRAMAFPITEIWKNICYVSVSALSSAQFFACSFMSL